MVRVGVRKIVAVLARGLETVTEESWTLYVSFEFCARADERLSLEGRMREQQTKKGTWISLPVKALLSTPPKMTLEWKLPLAPGIDFGSRYKLKAAG